MKVSVNIPGLSVIVCGYNSATRLSDTIEHLAKQQVPDDISWEVIIVNNASTDNTSEIACDECNQYAALINRFKIIQEIKPGLTYARQKGAMVANYNYLVFCDDDNWLDSKYLHNAYRIMESDKQIGALGGKSTAVTNGIEFPEWFDSLKNGFAVGAQSHHQGDISRSCMLWGAGLVTRRNLFINCFPVIYPSILTGRKGSVLSCGEDTEFCFRLVLKGYKLFYDERLSFVHFIPKERLTPNYKTRLAQDGSSGKFDLRKYYQLYLSQVAEPSNKAILIIKTFLGFLSSKLLTRKSWAYQDVIRIIFFTTKIDLGVDASTWLIYNFYKNCDVNNNID